MTFLLVGFNGLQITPRCINFDNHVTSWIICGANPAMSEAIHGRNCRVAGEEQTLLLEKTLVRKVLAQ